MIFRLEYCNKESVTARVDIQKGGATPIYTVEGTAEPFVLFYNNDNGDKSGSFRSSGADINIYETAEFNIDELKTSNETEISVKYYINNILNWSGFIIPDFFSETITGGKGVVSMVASDRLGTLKGATLSGLSARVSNRELAEDCLAQTGLSLPMYTMADFTGDGTNIFNSEVLSQRMVDTKGRNVSCYDILSSILEETNSLIVQRNGAWYIVNKLQLEAGVGSLYSSPVTSSAWVENTVSFDEVSVGARRTIKPVAATVGVYHEHGGGRLHPNNYDFSGGSTGWVSPNGFPFTIVNNQIKQYEKVGSTWNVEFGGADRNRMQINKQWDGLPANLDVIQYVSNSFPVVTTSDDSVTVGIDISVTGNPLSIARFTVLAEGDGKRFAFNPSSGAFEEYDDAESKFLINISPSGPYLGDNKYDAANEAIAYSAKLNVENISDYNISIRVYGTNIPVISGGGFAPMFVDFASVKFSNTADSPKGVIFKTTQGANYTKDHDIKTVLWGDYLTYGLNGYFYSYPIDDTSSLYRPTGELHSGWTAYGDTDTLPLLQHITRQKSRMFSVAHDLLSADITTSTFDPLSVFVDCDNTRYVVVSARFDFLRSNVSVELEEVAYATNSKRDYIYSYFGDGEEGIRSIGGISGGTGGGGSTGGGLTPEQLEILSFWKKDPDNPNTIFTEMNAYSKLELSAYGAGTGGGGGGEGVIETVYGYGNLGQTFNNSILTDTFNAYTINSIHERVQVLEAGGGGGGSTVEWGTLTNGYRQLTVEGVTYALAQNTHKHLWADITDKPSTFTPSAHSHGWSEITDKPSTFTPSAHSHGWSEITGKPSTFAPSSHTHSAGDITSGTFAIARIPTGTTGTTVALGNHLHTGVYEPVFSKNTAFNKNFGTTSGTVAEGNDSRIINGQTAFSWGNHSGLYLPLTGGTMTNTNLVTNLNADLLDGKHGYQYRGEVSLSYVSDYQQVVIGLVNLDNSDAGRQSWSSGQLYANRPNGGVWGAVVVNYSLQKRYNSVNMYAYLNSTLSGIELCTFTYNGTKYGGIRFFPSETQVFGGLKLYGRWSDVEPFTIAYRNNSGVLNSEVDSSIIINGSDILEQRLRTGSNIYAFTSDNVASATKLQTARTIAGVSFDGTANIAIPFANLSSKPTTLGGYGITDAVTLNTAQTITGEKTFSGNVVIKGAAANSPLRVRGIDGYIDNTGLLDNLYLNFVSAKDILMVNGGGNVGIGTVSPTQKLHVVGNILATGTTTTPKVIFNAAGWSMEQTGTELLLKYNNVVAQRFLSDGSIVGLGEITAYGEATTGGEGVALLRTGGTMTGNLTMSADIIMNSGRAIGVSNLPLKLLGNALTYNASNVLTEANTATQIKMGNGWTIEQTSASLTIRRNGVIKGTFNA